MKKTKNYCPLVFAFLLAITATFTLKANSLKQDLCGVWQNTGNEGNLSYLKLAHNGQMKISLPPAPLQEGTWKLDTNSDTLKLVLLDSRGSIIKTLQLKGISRHKLTLFSRNRENIVLQRKDTVSEKSPQASNTSNNSPDQKSIRKPAPL